MNAFMHALVIIVGFFAALAVVTDLTRRWCKRHCDTVLGPQVDAECKAIADEMLARADAEGLDVVSWIEKEARK